MTSAVPTNNLLGARLVDGGAQFGLWAPRATRVELVLVAPDNQQTNLDLQPGPAGIWSTYVAGVVEGQHYGYRVHGEWNPDQGSRFNPARLLLDPYARAIFGGIDYRGPIHDHTDDDPFVADTRDSFGSVPLSVVVADTPPPTPIAKRRPLAESVIYEMHVRGFTKMHPLVPEHLRASFAGLAYPEVVAYLRDLGITAVQLMPIHHFVSEPFVAHRGLRNYWGYNTLGFFAPHAFYATRGGSGGQVAEFKAMVSALHEAGIEVILDVVYNHTAEGGHEGPTLSMRGIDHDAYYRLINNKRDDYDVTGCGNSVNTAHPMARQMILDSLRYWVTEMGVDGFRFDLATTLIRDERHHVDQAHPFKQALASDPTFEGIKLIAEPWDIGPYGYQVGAWGPGWSEFNDRFRDHIREFWRGSITGVQELATRLAGSPDLYDRPGRSPQASINFVAVHDGFTMRDLVSYDIKHNRANGEANRDGSDNNRSWNHGWEGETDDPAINDLRARQVLNMHATQILAAGVPFLLAGDEFGRTQKGNNNAYCQDSPISWVDWDLDERWEQVRQRVSQLLNLRAAEPLLRTAEYLYHSDLLDAAGEPLKRVDLTWMDGERGQMGEEDWHDPNRQLLGMYLSNQQAAYLVWFHSGTQPREIILPSLPWASSYQIAWDSVIDGELPREQELAAGSEFTLPGRSVILLQAKVPTTASQLAELEAAAANIPDLAG